MQGQGACVKKRIVYGVTVVSDKGQVVIPKEAREDLGIRRGDLLLVLGRRDGAGVTLIKLSMMDKLMEEIQEDDMFFMRKVRVDRQQASTRVQEGT